MTVNIKVVQRSVWTMICKHCSTKIHIELNKNWEKCLKLNEQQFSDIWKRWGRLRSQENEFHTSCEKNKNERIDTCHSLLVIHNKKSFLWTIITGDKKWIGDEKWKWRSDPGESSRSIPKRKIHTWWNWKGTLYHELLLLKQTVTASDLVPSD